MMRVKPILFAFLLSSLVLGFVGQATSATLSDSEAAITFSQQGILGVGVQGNTVGWGFSLDEEKTLTHLGIYNFNGSGSADSDRQIGIWDSSGTLVVQAILPQGGGELADDFIWIAPSTEVLLKANEAYTIGAWYHPDNSPGVAYNASVSTINGVNYEKPSLISSNPSFTRPTVDFTGFNPNGFFGPNMRFGTDSRSRVRADRDNTLFERNQRRRNLLLNLAENYPLCGPETQNQRFVVSEDGNSVCDNNTGLWWQQSPSTTFFAWANAVQHCENLTLSGKTWRLAEVKEYLSLVDYSAPNQAGALNTPNGPFTHVQSSFYWSATELAGTPPVAWLVGFSLGGVLDSDKVNSNGPAWCVSGGQDAN